MKFKKMTKRGASFFLALVMCVSLLQVPAYAAGDAESAEALQDTAAQTDVDTTVVTSDEQSTVQSEVSSNEIISNNEPIVDTSAVLNENFSESTEASNETSSEISSNVNASTEEITEIAGLESNVIVENNAALNSDNSIESNDSIDPEATDEDEFAEDGIMPTSEDDPTTEDAVCICEYRCSPVVIENRWDGDVEHCTWTADCPVCGPAGKGNATYVCMGKQVIADGNPSHSHSWMTSFGPYSHIEANCTTSEAWTVVDFGCGAEWLFAFNVATGLNPNVHYYSDYKPVVVPATCTQNGTKTNTCLLCGKEVVETIPAIGHKFEADVEITPATCLTDGSKTGTCTVCGETVTEVIPAGGHQLGKYVVAQPATCVADGSKTATCSLCGETVTESIPATGHSKPGADSITRVEPTCTEDGSETYACAVCGDSITEALSATGHTFKDSGHGNVGNINDKGVCTKCGTTFYSIYTYEDGATPSGSGYETKYCGTIVKEANGNTYGIDPDGNRMNDATALTLIVNEALMGKTKTTNGTVTRVLGYRDIDNENGTIYGLGGLISFDDIINMVLKPKGWNNYYSNDNAKTIYLSAVREEVTVNKGEYSEDLTIDPVKPIVFGNLSNGVKIDVTDLKGLGTEDIDAYITVTIDENAPIDSEVIINLAGALGDDIRVEPGDRVNFYITLVDNSGRNYQYVENSAVLGTFQNKPVTGDILGIGFDGNPISAEEDEYSMLCIPRRVLNTALQALGVTQSAGMSDAVIGNLLRAVGYGDSEELTDDQITQKYLGYYYLDFLNSSNGTSYTSFQDLNVNDIKTLMNDNGNIAGNAIRMNETCAEVAEALYYFYYGRAFTFNGEPLYNYMADPSKVNNGVKDALNSADKTYVLHTKIDGEIVGNAGQNTYLVYNHGLKFNLKPAEPETPDEPTPPTTPDRPSRPTPPTDIPDPDVPLSPGPDPEEPPVIIEEPDVPLAELPPEVEIPEPEVPLAGQPPVTTTIPEPEVPLSDVPMTGDASGLWYAVLGLAACGLVVLNLRKKEEL